MTVFVSYASRDKDAVKSLTQDLQDADEQVWMDQRLAGGEAWWRAILEQIRGCDVFIFALSQNSIESRPCEAELQYAQALGLPILPVQVGPVDSMQLNPLATVQAIDYRHPTPSTAMRLSAALHRERARRQPLPSPLPDEPPVPFEYLIRLYTTIAGPEQLSPRDQAALVAQLQVGLREDGQHEAARKDIVMLLGKLRDREDVTYRTRTDVDAILSSIDAVSRTPPPTATETTATTLDALSDIDLRAETDAHRVMDLVADPGWADALGAFFAKRWPEAVERFEALHARYPGEARVETRLDEARRQRDVAAWSERAEAAAADGDWDTVVGALESLTALDAEHPDAAARLEQARTAQRRKALIDEMTALHQAGQWEAVVAAAAELARIDPDNPDPGGIVSDAHAKIRDAELADRYAQALNHLDQQRWQQAADLLTAIEQEHPGYRDAATLLTTARHNLEAEAPAAEPTAPPAQPPPAHGPAKKTTEGVDLGAWRHLAEHAERDPAPQGATTEGAQGAHPGVTRGAVHEAEQEREPRTTARPEQVPLFERINRRTKNVLAAVALVVVVAGVVATVLVSHKSGQGALSQVVLPFTGLHEPEGVAVDGAGNLYVTDSNRVLKLAAGASTPTELPFTGLNEPAGVAVDGAGSVYVTETPYPSTDHANNRVLKLAAGASTQDVLPFTGLYYPQGVAVDGAGNLYVTDAANNRVLKLAAGASTQDVLPFTGLNFPWGVAVDGAGNLYVTDGENNRVLKLAAGASTPTKLPFTGLHYPQGVAVDGAGNLYVTDGAYNNRVLKLAAGASTPTELPFTGLHGPVGVAVDSTGSVYVTDASYNNNRVLKLAAG